MAEMTYKHIPLIGKDISEQGPQEYYDMIGSLYQCPKEAVARKREKSGKKKASDLGFRVNDRGTLIITVRNRKPKWASADEVREMAKEHRISERELFILFGKKGIEIKHDN